MTYLDRGYAKQVSQKNLVVPDAFSVDRRNCETAVAAAKTHSSAQSNAPTNLATSQLLDFMNLLFGFTADESVAIVGAHTLGRALPEDSGFQGQNGWTNNVFALDKWLVGLCTAQAVFAY